MNSRNYSIETGPREEERNMTQIPCVLLVWSDTHLQSLLIAIRVIRSSLQLFTRDDEIWLSIGIKSIKSR